MTKNRKKTKKRSFQQDGVSSKPATPSVPNSIAQPDERETKRRAYSPELTFSQMDVVAKSCDGMLDKLQAMTTALKKEGVDELLDEELALVLTSLQTMRDRLREAKRRRSAEPNLTIVSFSNISDSHIKGMGIKYEGQLDLAQSQKLSEVVEDSLQPGARELLQGGGLEKLLESHAFWYQGQELIQDHVDMLTNEAGARITIDHVLLEAAHCCKKLSQGGAKCLRIFPELRLSKATLEDGANVVVEFGDKKTLISGTTDYAVLLLSEEELSAHHSRFRDLDSLVQAVGPENLLLLLEAKKSSVSLQDYLGQVLAQGVATMKQRAKAGKNEVEYALTGAPIPFCLSQGTQWIFGIIAPANPKTSEWIYKAVVVHTVNASLDSPEGLRDALKWLLLWILAQPTDIVKAMGLDV